MISTVISSSVLIVIVIILRAIFRSKISSRVQYAIWGVVLIRLLLPFPLYSSPVSMMNVLKSVDVVDTISERTANSTESGNNTKKEFNHQVLTNENENIGNQATLNDVSKNKPLSYGIVLTDVGVVVWVCGMLFIGSWFAVINIRFYIKLQESRKLFKVSNSKLPVYIVNDLFSPCLFGLYRPVIYLTSQAIKDEETMCHVLTHELIHYKHKDHIWAFLRSVSLIIYWFNPLVWIAASLSKTDCELACDESTIKKIGEENRIQYGRTLVNLIASNSKFTDVMCTSTTMTFGKQEMKDRIKRIVKKPKTILLTLILVGIIISVAILFTFTGASSSIKAEKIKVTKKENLKDTLLQKLKTELPKDSIISDSFMDDFDKDNRLEMYVIIDCKKENTEDISKNQIWYTDGSSTKKLFEGGIYLDSVKIWDVGKQKLFYTQEGYGGSRSFFHVWSVKEGIPYELRPTGESLEYKGNGNFYIYPGEYDLKSDGTGHTWKPYYLYFDETTGDFKEYGGILISKEDFLKLNGALTIYDEIIKNGYRVSEIFYRKNDIININYNNSEYNFNVSMTVKDGSVTIENLASLKHPDFDLGGNYEAAIFEDIATYPENFNSALTNSIEKSESTSNQLEATLPKSLDEAVSFAVKNSVQSNKKGAFIAEAHIVLDLEKSADIVKAYLVSSYTNFRFENNIFIADEINGFAAVITCEINKKGEYRIINFEQSGEGTDYNIFIKKHFPETIWHKALAEKSYYPENLWKKVFEEKGYLFDFEKEKEKQAKQYLKSINSNASLDMDGFLE